VGVTFCPTNFHFLILGNQRKYWRAFWNLSLFVFNWRPYMYFYEIIARNFSPIYCRK